MTFHTAQQKLHELLQQLRKGHTALRCMQISFGRMQPPYHPDPEAIEELVWFVLGQGVQTFSFPNGDLFVVYANEFNPKQVETFLSHLPAGSADFMITHSTDAQLDTLIARLQG